MKKNTTLKWLFIICLIIPMIFLNKTQFIIDAAPLLDFILFGGLAAVVAILGYLLLVKILTSDQLAKFKQHNIIQAIKHRDLGFIFTDFLGSMVFEEVVFRYYVLGILLLEALNPIGAVLINGVIFAGYHFHMYAKFPSKRFMGVILGYTFILAVYLGYLFMACGWIATFIAHTLIVGLIYYNLAQN